MNPGAHLSPDVGAQRMGLEEGSFGDGGGEAGEEEVKKQHKNFTTVSLCRPIFPSEYWVTTLAAH